MPSVSAVKRLFTLNQGCVFIFDRLNQAFHILQFACIAQILWAGDIIAKPYNSQGTAES